MTLLFITRKIDHQDPRAGFVSEWIEKFSQKLDKLIIICQEQGDITGLPNNIKIYSLGKEKGNNKFKQFILLNCYLVKLLKKTNGVFAHMMPIYSIIAGPWCKLFRKKLIQWYTHKSIGWKLKLANIFVDEFVSASKESFRLKTKKTVNIFGHGINTDVFKPSNKRNYQLPVTSYQLLTIGRISPSKDYESMIKAVYELQEHGINNIKLTIVGAPGLASQKSYLEVLKIMVVNMKLENQVDFTGPIPHLKTVSYLQQADLFLNLSDTGSLDKAVLGAMACECLVLTSNQAFQPILPKELLTTKDSPAMLADKIKQIMNWPSDKKQELTKTLRQEVVAHHNLDKLVQKIVSLYNAN